MTMAWVKMNGEVPNKVSVVVVGENKETGSHEIDVCGKRAKELGVR